MKRSLLSLLLFLVSSMLLVISCDKKPADPSGEDPGSTPVTPVYIEVRSYEVMAGDAFTISFTTPEDWTASSDVKWLIPSETAGRSGNIKLGCTVSSDDPNYKTNSEGHLTIKVAEREFVFPVTRAKMERSLRIICAGNDITTLGFDANKGETSAELTVEANFYWDLDITQEWPVWIERLKITDGKLGDDGLYRNTFTLTLNEAELDGNDRTGALTFTDIDDESFTFVLPVSYTALVVPEVPFAIQCELGTDLHVNKMGMFKDAGGNLTSHFMMLDFQVITPNADELIVITPTGVKHGEGAGFIQTEPVNKFITVAASSAKVDGGVGYTMIVTPGLLENANPKSICDMGYVLVLPKAIYEPYEKFFSATDPNYQMAFMWMRIDNYLFRYMYDADGNQVNDRHGNLVSVPKETMTRYMLTVTIDED